MAPNKTRIYIVNIKSAQTQYKWQMVGITFIHLLTEQDNYTHEQHIKGLLSR